MSHDDGCCHHAIVLTADRLHTRLTATPQAVRATLNALLSTPPFCALTADQRGTAEIVLAEALNNIVEHAYAQSVGEIDVFITARPDGLHCAIYDNGTAMPGKLLPKGILKPLQDSDLPEGGFGWFLIRALTDGLHYTRHADQNELQFVLRFIQSAPATGIVSIPTETTQ